METKVAIVKDIKRDSLYIKEAAKIIAEGGTVAFPTETVYGLGANALNEAAVKNIFLAKGRPQDNPLIVHVANKDIHNLVEKIPEIAEKIMDKFWPGAITIIMKKKNIIPNVTSANLDTVGIRMPSNPVALKLIEYAGLPIAAPSANISGSPSPTDYERCIEDLSGRVDFILGGEKSEVGVESTIIDCTVEPPIILRPGGITLEMLRELHPGIRLDEGLMKKPTDNFKPKAPGMKYRHYAPKAKVKVVKGNEKKTVEKVRELVSYYVDEGLKVGILASKENSLAYNEGEVIILGSKINLSEVAQNLFEALRALDDKKVDIIIAEGYDEGGVGLAIMNRLQKSAGYDIINV